MLLLKVYFKHVTRTRLRYKYWILDSKSSTLQYIPLENAIYLSKTPPVISPETLQNLTYMYSETTTEQE